MKWSQTPPTLQIERKQYIDTRWKQYSDVADTWGEEAVKFLLVINAGAMAAALSFFGAMGNLRALLWPKVALSFFVGGLVFLGLYHFSRNIRIWLMFKGWRQDVHNYIGQDAIVWNELLQQDELRARKADKFILGLAVSSFVCFLSGLAVAAINFSDVAQYISQGTEDERKKEPASTTPTPPPTGEKPSATPVHTGQKPDAGHKNSNSKGATTKPGPNSAK